MALEQLAKPRRRPARHSRPGAAGPLPRLGLGAADHHAPLARDRPLARSFPGASPDSRVAAHPVASDPLVRRPGRTRCSTHRARRGCRRPRVRTRGARPAHRVVRCFVGRRSGVVAKSRVPGDGEPRCCSGDVPIHRASPYVASPSRGTATAIKDRSFTPRPRIRHPAGAADQPGQPDPPDRCRSRPEGCASRPRTTPASRCNKTAPRSAWSSAP